MVSNWVSECNHPQNEGYSEKGVQGAVEHVPERNVKPADFPELIDLITYKANGEDVEQTFDNVKISRGIDGVDGASIQGQEDEGEANLHPVLVPWHTHAVRVQVCPVACVRLVFVGDETTRIVVVLDHPPTPEVVDALLVT
jgi:hypothetical protein